MEKTRSEILSEIQEELAALKARIAQLEGRLATLEETKKEEPVEEAVTGLVAEPVELPVEEPVEQFAEEPADQPAGAEDLNPIDISIDEVDLASPGFEEPAAAPAEGLLVDEVPAVPKASINDRQERNVKKAVMDVMGQKLAWKTAIPGSPVKNVISAISLNDRVLFINTLFKEDPIAFQDAIAAFNAMSSFAEAEEYVRTSHPEWNLNSDLVFRLMMAVRRKLR